MGDFLNLVWILVLLQIFIPLIQQRMQATRRLMAIRTIETRRQSRVITMIHRQETMSLLGLPIARYIDIEDSEQVLRAIRLTQPEMPIDLILHTPGGLVLAAEQIAWALKRHPGKVTVLIPHYAMSGGTLVALAADEIVMDPDAVMGPVDPQLGSQQSGYFPAASILKALEQPNPNRDDQTLILGDIARKAIEQVHETVVGLLLEHQSHEKADQIARMLSDGRWTHDYSSPRRTGRPHRPPARGNRTNPQNSPVIRTLREAEVMLTLAIPAWQIVVRTTVIYLAVFLGLRVLGKREIGQMTVFDLVVILLIANAVQNAMVGADDSLTGGVLAAFVLLAANRIVSALRLRSPSWGRLLEGTPTVLVQNGEFIEPHLRKEGVERTELEMAMREHGLESVSGVKLAVLETDGSISIVPKDSPMVRTRRHIRQFRKH